MDLYTHLAKLYDRIFPINPATISFIDRCAAKGKLLGRAIDLGSASGSHAYALAEKGWEVVGVELSVGLLDLARDKRKLNGSSVEFLQADMRDIGKLFAPASADLILCLGNTLPHLATIDEVRDFLVNTRLILRKGGWLILQLVNFDLVGPGFVFPLIEGDGFRFERSYEGLSDGKIAFDTRLSFDDGQSFDDRTPLLPLYPALLESALTKAGYSIESRNAGWDGSAFDPATSAYLVIVAAAA